ncbi:CpsD/CapB family tyrosine-protein kinase [Haliea sp. E17]|uniref:CpsD/CapB family tyrosine-protein kinase n=1 Tax=Haliea sp. E17 TaxID=3401576 RepID=UPI003AAA53DE
MDYLQRAIEKAREQREGSIGNTPAPGQGVSSPNGNESTAPQREKALAPGMGVMDSRASRRRESVRVDYTRTRTIKLDKSRLARNRVIAAESEDARVESYRQLRSHVLSKMKRGGWRTLAITSPHEGAGKTLTAINLAVSISQEVNQTVMLVDVDLRNPSIHRTLGVEIDKGIVDHLTNGEPLENILFNPGYPRLVILPGLPQELNASELLSSPAMNNFMSEIIGRYPDRIIIFDLPPLLRNDDAMVFAPSVDSCLLVVEDGENRPDEIKRCLKLLKDEPLMGVILNKVR